MERLADGINLVTGEVLPENDNCDQIEIVRALNSVLRHIGICFNVNKKALSHDKAFCLLKIFD